MVGPSPPGVGGLATNMRLLTGSSLARRFDLRVFPTTKRRRHVFPNRPHWDSIPYLLYHTVALGWTILRRRPDLVYVKATSDTGFLRDTVLMTVARVLGRPVLCHLHGRPMGRLFRRDPPGFVRWGMARAAVTVVLSPGLARQFEAMFPGRRLEVVPNVVEVGRFRPGERPPGGGLRILTVGRLSREKGTWDLLEVAALLRGRGVEAEFRLVGIGETAAEERALRARAAAAGLDDTVVFLGSRRGEDLVREYAGADVFFLPTHAEIFPNVVLEALAAGLPVVTTNVPVIPEMFGPVEGILHDPGDTEGMAGSLERLSRDAALRASMGAAARGLAETRYHVEAAADRLATLFEEMLNGRGRRAGSSTGS